MFIDLHAETDSNTVEAIEIYVALNKESFSFMIRCIL